jgi:hypothetical protein
LLLSLLLLLPEDLLLRVLLLLLLVVLLSTGVISAPGLSARPSTTLPNILSPARHMQTLPHQVPGILYSPKLPEAIIMEASIVA